MRRFFRVVIVTALIMAGLVGVSLPSAAQTGDCDSCDDSGGGVTPDGRSVFAMAGGLLVGAYSDGCLYSLNGLGLEHFLPGGAFSNVNADLSAIAVPKRYAAIKWDCDDDGAIDGNTVVEVVTAEMLAAQALQQVELPATYQAY